MYLEISVPDSWSQPPNFVCYVSVSADPHYYSICSCYIVLEDFYVIHVDLGIHINIMSGTSFPSLGVVKAIKDLMLSLFPHERPYVFILFLHPSF